MRDRDVIRVLLADDHPALRVGLRILLDRESDIAVVGEASNGLEALAMVESLRPAVVVLDCQLPGMEGASVAAEIGRSEFSTAILALSAYDDDCYIAAMYKANAAGYLLKNEAPSQIVNAVRAIAKGGELWSAKQVDRASRWEAEVIEVRDSLTQREREVLYLIAEGLSNKEIAQRLVVTVRTADFHVSNILRKLDVVSRVEAAVWAQQHLLGR
ncbi:MAG: response regulator [Anaerolineae bacterium]